MVYYGFFLITTQEPQIGFLTPLDKWCHKASMHKGKIDISVHARLGNPIINVTDAASAHSRSNASRSSDRSIYPFFFTQQPAKPSFR